MGYRRNWISEGNGMKDMIRMGESSVIEFKTEDAHNISIAKEVAAFSNSCRH